MIGKIGQKVMKPLKRNEMKVNEDFQSQIDDKDRVATEMAVNDDLVVSRNWPPLYSRVGLISTPLIMMSQAWENQIQVWWVGLE